MDHVIIAGDRLVEVVAFLDPHFYGDSDSDLRVNSLFTRWINSLLPTALTSEERSTYLQLDACELWWSPPLITTIMTPDPVLELSVEQHISALNKKLSLECTRLQQTMPLASRALAATLKIKVWTS